MTATTEPTNTATLEWLDPSSLLLDRNVRTVTLDKAFLASVREHGVLVPIRAVRTDDGQVRVRMGERRALAAIESGHPRVPVLIAGDEDDDDVARIIGQWHENQHRAGLSDAEQTGAVEQLALLGVSAAAIAKKLREPRKRVDAALTVSASELAKQAAARYDFLTLDQSAELAKHDDDTEAVTALIAAAKQGPVQFARVAAKAAEDRARRDAHTELADRLAAEGVRVVTETDYAAGTKLDRLVDADGNDLDPDAHAVCPGHAALIIDDWYEVPREQGQHEQGQTENGQTENGQTDDDAPTYDDSDDAWVYGPTPLYLCTDPAEHGHRSRWESHGATSRSGAASESERASAEAKRKAEEANQRRVTRANNAEWRTAEPIRRDWLRALAARKTAPKGAAAFIATATAHDPYTLSKPSQRTNLATELLAVSDIDSALTTASDARALVIALVVVLAAYEADTRVDSWRSHHRAEHRYFGWLAANGYPLCRVESLAAGIKASEIEQNQVAA